MKVLFIGDIVGKAGRHIISIYLPRLKEEHNFDFIIANAENSAGGFGLTPKIANQLFSLGIDLLTTGNHVFSKKEIFQILDEDINILRPINYPIGVPGKGSLVLNSNGLALGVINTSGRVFLSNLDCPFRVTKNAADALKKYTKNIIVDMHSEATSEKVAIGYYLDGKVSAIIGTHTHIQTADEKILPEGTAYITDVGMTGPSDSVIGVKKDIAIKRFLTQMNIRLEVAKGSGYFCGAIITIDHEKGIATHIERLQVYIS
ncbi:MAG: TIGR00282 family metallophosphoesterase [bacterium]|nr:TIGR00282 family metallophosphoesterase [bacterium]